MAYFQEQKSEYFCPLCLGVGVAKKKQNAVKALDGTTLYSHGDRGGGLQQWILATMCLLAAYSGQLFLMHPSWSAPEGSHTLTIRDSRSVVLARRHMTHVLKQSKGVQIESERGKRVSTQDAKSSTGCMDSISSEESVPGLLGQSGSWKTAHMRLLSLRF